MLQAQLRNFIPEMLRFSTGKTKPGWGKPECRPLWWPPDVPWANVRSDVREEEEKKLVMELTGVDCCLSVCMRVVTATVAMNIHAMLSHTWSFGLELILVSWQLAHRWLSQKPSGSLPLLSTRRAVTFPTEECHCHLAGVQLYCLVTDCMVMLSEVHCSFDSWTTAGSPGWAPLLGGLWQTTYTNKHFETEVAQKT